MSFPIRTCVKCGEEFELRPGKPGFANRCLTCTEEEAEEAAEAAGGGMPVEEKRGLDEARRAAMKDLLYRKDS